MGTSGGMASTDHTGSCLVEVIDECRSERLHSAGEWWNESVKQPQSTVVWDWLWAAASDK